MMQTLPVLLTVNIVVWIGVLIYVFRLIPPLTRGWRPWIAALCLVVAGSLSAITYVQAPKLQRQEAARRHYFAGLDEKQRGNLTEAEKELEKAVSLQPGIKDADEQLKSIRQEKPAEQREVRRDTRVDVPAPSPSPSPTPTPAPPAGNSPPVKPTPPPPGSPGEKPKPVAHLPSPFEITHYDLSVDIDPKPHTLDATATIRLRSRGGSVPSLDFSLNPECKPSLAQLDGSTVPFTHVNDLLTLKPARPLGPGKEATVVVRYHREGRAIMGKGEGLISTMGCYFLSDSRWYPATGELDFRSPVSVHAHVPKGYTVVSIGALRKKETDEHGTRFHWETDRLASMVSLAVGHYVQQSVTVPLPLGGGGPAATGQPARGDLKITCYTFEEHRDRAPQFLKEAGQMVRFYERQFGPYPYEKLGIAEIPLFPGGYGSTSFVMLIDRSFSEKKLDREFLAHEIAHQWWGNSVFPQGMGAAWLTEAFANYSAWLYEASIRGNPKVLRQRVAKATQEYFSEAKLKGDQALYETDPYQQVGAAQQIVYEKGAVVLHMLRRQVGDAAFFRSLRAFADQYRFGKAKIEDFRAVAERESGQQLGWFFDQWLGRTGGMALTYSYETQRGTALHTNDGLLTITQPEPPYRGKMKVVLQVDNTVEAHEIELLGQPSQTFTFPVKGKITSVLLDPENTYLMSVPRWHVPDPPVAAGTR